MSIDLWQRGCDRLATELPEQQFNTWIRPLPAADISDEGEAGAVASVRVPNRFKLDWIRSQYAHRIEGVLSDIAGKPVRLELTLAPRELPAARPLPAGQPVRAAALLNGQAIAPSTSVRPAALGPAPTGGEIGRAHV
jgi:chromosomal replication initiator protein